MGVTLTITSRGIMTDDINKVTTVLDKLLRRRFETRDTLELRSTFCHDMTGIDGITHCGPESESL